jgi:hypothetical protein
MRNGHANQTDVLVALQRVAHHLGTWRKRVFNICRAQRIADPNSRCLL